MTQKLFEKVGIKLSDGQLLQLGKDHAAKCKEVREVEDEKSEALNTFNARIKTLAAEAEDMERKINDREDQVDVEVREEPDDGRNTIVTVRVDNGQTLKTRPMTLNEMAEANHRRKGGAVDDEDGETTEVSDTDPPEAETSPSKAKGKGRKSNGRIKAAPASDVGEISEEVFE